MPSSTTPGFEAGLRELCERVARQWGLAVTLDVVGAPPAISGSLASDITYIVHEALANAARHGEATAVGVRVRFGGSEVTVAVSDDGHGFPFRGRYALPTLIEKGVGPSSLKERVADLAGDLYIDSASTGSRVEVRLHLQPTEA